jgi:pimeloyl-ACP methyl ester carboxylesterase
VLIPGAGGAAWLWSRVVRELKARGHDAIAVDLPAEDEGAGLPEYAQVVLKAAAGRENIVLVGQSMGAFPAVQVCDQLPVTTLVLVNPMIPNPGETPGEWWANTGQEQAMRDNDLREGRSPDAEFDVNTYFLHDLPPDVLAEIGDNDRRQSEAIFGSPLNVSVWPTAPTRVISGRDDRFFPLDFQRRLARERIGIIPDVIPGGHLAALSHPAELVDVLDTGRSLAH